MSDPSSRLERSSSSSACTVGTSTPGVARTRSWKRKKKLGRWEGDRHPSLPFLSSAIPSSSLLHPVSLCRVCAHPWPMTHPLLSPASPSTRFPPAVFYPPLFPPQGITRVGGRGGCYALTVVNPKPGRETQVPPQTTLARTSRITPGVVTRHLQGSLPGLFRRKTHLLLEWTRKVEKEKGGSVWPCYLRVLCEMLKM